MAQASTTIHSASSDRRQVEVLARSLYREMCSQGFRADQMIGVSSALLELVSDELSSRPALRDAG